MSAMDRALGEISRIMDKKVGHELGDCAYSFEKILQKFWLSNGDNMINMMTKEEENRRERGIDIEEFVFIGGEYRIHQ